jgi:hypothetical protein
MNYFEEFAAQEDLVELSKQRYFTIVLDENLRGLESALEDDGFKVVVPHQDFDDETFKRKARGWAILTNNSMHFIDDAVRHDYDVIGIEGVNFIDVKADRTNETVHKISDAVRRSQLGNRRGNFLLKIKDNGSFHLQQLL